ncbi:hypothetical protein [Paenibacillus tengchongensis]|uniref:hypothetical protein n=1 Tax=Paenibacillus tengchongensis TaxID=2608684 RepID=UPI00124D7B7C|nr:hypothetical protein [Paenibacillus tengchongensis]
MYENGAIIVEARTELQGGYAKCGIVPYLDTNIYDENYYKLARQEAFTHLITELTGVTFSNVSEQLVNRALNENIYKYDTKREIPGLRITFYNRKVTVDKNNVIYEHTVCVLESNTNIHVYLVQYECPNFGGWVQHLMKARQEDLALEFAALLETNKLKNYYYLVERNV